MLASQSELVSVPCFLVVHAPSLSLSATDLPPFTRRRCQSTTNAHSSAHLNKNLIQVHMGVFY